MFPFNYLRRVGSYLVVAPHHGLCPLTVVAHGEYAEHSVHEKLLESMSAHGLAAHVPAASVGESSVEECIALERSILAASEQYLGNQDYRSFVREQAQLTVAHSNAREKPVDSLGICESYIKAILGVESPSNLIGHRELVKTLVACTPALRSHMIFQPLQPEAGQSSVRDRSRVPYALLALYYIAAEAMRAGMKRVTYQTLIGLEREFRALIALLSHSDLPMQWRRNAPIELAGAAGSEQRRAVLTIATSLLPNRQRKNPRTLGDIMLFSLPPDPIQRVLLLKNLARRLDGRIVPLGIEVHQPVASGRRVAFRRTVQRWVLDVADDDMKESLYDTLAVLASPGR